MDNYLYEKKKVLIINQHFSTGGIKKSLENLLRELTKKYNVKVILISGSTKEFDEKFPTLRLKSPFVISSALSSLKDINSMNHRWIRTFIKIIYFYVGKVIGYEAVCKIAVSMSRYLGEYDCVISYAHDNWFEDGTFFGGGNRLAVKKTQSHNRISWVHGEPKTIGLTSERIQRTYKEFNHIVAVSDAVKKQFEEMSNEKYFCEKVNNLFDVEEIHRKISGIDYEKINNVFRIVTVGRLSKVAKRIDKINEVARLLKKNGYKFKWTVVGGGSEYEPCVRKCREYGLDKMVEYVGNQDNPYSYMKQSDLFVLVSDTEAMPVVINEALIVGTPVVTTNFPSAYETINDGINGLICGKSVEEIYEKVAYCINNIEVVNKIRANIIKHPVNNEESIRKLERLIR